MRAILLGAVLLVGCGDDSGIPKYRGIPPIPFYGSSARDASLPDQAVTEGSVPDGPVVPADGPVVAPDGPVTTPDGPAVDSAPAADGTSG